MLPVPQMTVLTPLHMAAREGDQDKVKELVEQGADVNVTYGHSGITPLYMAADGGHVNIVEFLVDNGAKIDVKEYAGLTPLHKAATHGYKAIVVYLVDKGADFNTKDLLHRNPLHSAAKGGRMDVLEYLAKKSHIIDIKDCFEKTPLHLAAGEGHLDIVKCLVQDKSANIYVKDTQGLTPLHRAARRGRRKVVEYLVGKGARIDSKDNKQKTSLHWAAEGGHENTVKYLVCKDASKDIKDCYGRTPCDVAKERGHMNIVQYLSGTPDEPYDVSKQGQCPEATAVLPQMEKHLATLEQAIQQKEMLNKTIMQCVFIGIPRSGKTSLMKRIVGEDLPRISPSTGVATKAVQVLVRPSAATVIKSVNKSDLTWTKLNDNEEAAIVVMDTSRCLDPVGCNPTPATDIFQSQLNPVIGDSTPDIDTFQSQLNPVIGDSTPDIDTFQSQLNPVIGDSTPDIDSSQSFLDPVVGDSSTLEAVAAVPQPELTTKGPIGICRHALQNAEKILREPGCLVYLTDTGGQIEFQELLPQLLSGPTVFFLVFPLDKKLKKRFEVKYVYHDGSESEPYMSTFTLQEALIQSLTSIASMASNETQVFFIGTHSDNVSETEINRINDTLQHSIRSKGLGYKNIVQNGSESRMLLAVNNLSDNDSGIQQVREAVERLHTLKKFNICASPSWLILGLIIRQLKDSVLSYKVCLEEAKKCNITTEKELNEALSFLHTKVGVIRHFQEEGLQNIVILNPQVLFDCITTLVEKTFTFENDPTVWKEFKKKGIFPFSTIEESSKSLITSSWLVKLLKYLHIIAPLKEQKEEEKYFMPCALARAQQAKTTSEFCRGQSAHQIPSLLVCFTNGYCPHGLFAALVVHLLAKQKMKQGFQWRLKLDEIFKNQISFVVGPCYTVSITMWPDFFEITCTPPSCEVRGIGPTEVCLEVRKCIKTGIHKVTQDLQYRDTHYLAYECTRNHQGPNQMEFHTAAILDSHGNKLTLETSSDSKPCTLECKLEEDNLSFPPGHDIWFPEVNESQRQGRQSSGETGSSKSDALPELVELVKSLEAENEELRKQLDQDKPKSNATLTLKNIDQMLTEVLDWHTLGIKLGLTDHSLGEIQINYTAYGIGRQRQEMISSWLKYDREASWSKLARALEKMGNNTLAAKIWNAYVPCYRDDQTPPNEAVRSRERDRRINMAPVKHRLSDDFSLEPELKTVRVSSPKLSVERHMSHKGGGSRQEREREWDSSAMSKSSDFQIAPPPPPHDNKRGQKRSLSGSSVSDDSPSPPLVKKKQQHKKRRHSSPSPLPQKPDESREQNEEDQISELEIGQSTGRTAGSSDSDALPELMELNLKIKSLEAEIEKLRRQLYPDKSKSNYLRGLNVIGEISILITSKAQTFHWVGYGLKLHIPQGALPVGLKQCELIIKVGISGQFALPQNTSLVSAVYWLHSENQCEFSKPLVLELQHCATSSKTSRLSFARCSHYSPPYNFEILEEGDFSPDGYGRIQLHNFSLYTVLMNLIFGVKYHARVYYLWREENQRNIHFVITKDLEAHATVVKKDYNDKGAIVGPHLPVEFEASRISLDLPSNGVPLEEGWRLLPLFNPEITKENVDSFETGQEIPSCQIRADWTKHGKPSQLTYKVTLKGAREPNNYFYIELDSTRGELDYDQTPDFQCENVDDTQIGEHSLVTIVDIIHTLAAKWFNLGLALRLPYNRLMSIESDFPRDSLRCLTETVQIWLQSSSCPSWRGLVSALRSPSVNRIDIADRIAKDHPSHQ